MTKSRIMRVSAAAVTSLGLVAGLAGIAGASSGTITGPTGPDSTNKIKNVNKSDIDVSNHNYVSATNSNPQHATSGEAEVHENTTGGNAQSGAATNSSTTKASVTLNNSLPASVLGGSGSSSSSGSIGNTGPDSTNKVKNVNINDVDVNNCNNITVNNTNDQTSSTGKAKVSDNTTGGNAVSGNASNTSNNEFTFNVTN